MKRNQKKAKEYTDMSFKWRDFRLQEEVNEEFDKRAMLDRASQLYKTNEKMFIKEIVRLLSSGAVGDETPENVILRVAYEALGEKLFYNTNKDYKNLKKF